MIKRNYKFHFEAQNGNNRPIFPTTKNKLFSLWTPRYGQNHIYPTPFPMRAWIAYSDIERELFYWRTRSGVEVDFVIYGPDGLWALEVKNSQKIHPADLRGLKSFKEEYPESRTFLLYRGKDRLMNGGILCLPCADFLLGFRPDLSLDEALR